MRHACRKMVAPSSSVWSLSTMPSRHRGLDQCRRRREHRTNLKCGRAAFRFADCAVALVIVAAATTAAAAAEKSPCEMGLGAGNGRVARRSTDHGADNVSDRVGVDPTLLQNLAGQPFNPLPKLLLSSQAAQGAGRSGPLRSCRRPGERLLAPDRYGCAQGRAARDAPK
jgi:hypothetical protein